MVDTNEAYKPSQRWILLVGLGSLVWARLKTVYLTTILGLENNNSFPTLKSLPAAARLPVISQNKLLSTRQRLPGLRAEILQSLLHEEGSFRGFEDLLRALRQKSLKCTLDCGLFHVDIQATHLVFRLAFPEHGSIGIEKEGLTYMTSADDEDLILSASKDVHDVVRYVLATVNALIEMLKSSYQITSDSKEVDTNSDDSEVHWP